MIRCQPTIQHLGHLDGPAAQGETARRFLAAVPGVTLDDDVYMSFMHGSVLARVQITDRRPAGAAPRLLCDEMLQGLGRWLRAAGYDTQIVRDSGPDSAVLASRARAARVLLTCDRPLAARAASRAPVLVLPAEGLAAQALAVRDALGIDWLWAPFSRCLRDNAPLRAAAAAERARVPPKARTLAGPVMACPACRRIYWRGSHARRMEQRLRLWRATAAPSGGA